MIPVSKSDAPGRGFGDLFVAITGESTITEPQRVDVPVRLDERPRDEAVSRYVDAAVRADGLEDALSDPDAD